MSEEDPFADVRGDIRGNLGIMEGLGASDHYAARERVTGAGVAYMIHCDNCGQPAEVEVTWNEFIYGMNRLLPPNWRHEAKFGGFHPNMGCRTCGALLLMILKPDECARQLKAGTMANKVTEEQVRSANQQLRQQLLAHQGR
jgi:hypothetical protein